MNLKLIQTYGVLIEKFFKDCQLRGMSNESIRGYRSNLTIFAKYIATQGINIDDINMQTLKEFLQYLKNERGVKHRTVEQYFSAISSFYDYLVFEEITNQNIVFPFRKRYLKRYKEDYDTPERRLLNIEEMSKLVNSIMDPRDKAIAILLAKTGIRRGELLRIDVDDIKWEDHSITLKPTCKRNNKVVFFDDECAIVLRRWLRVREKLNPNTKALLVSYSTFGRLSRNAAYNAVVKYAKRLGFHNSESPKLEDHFGPHCFRHWFTTWLLRNRLPREYVKELRGDRRSEAIDIYNHIDRQELRRTYLACIPKFGI